MTVGKDRQAKTVDPQTSLRTELLGQLACAQIELQRMGAELARSGAATAQGDNQLQVLAQLQREVGTADRTSLVALRGEIGAAIAASQAAVRQGHSADNNATFDMVRAAIAAREQVNSVMRGMKDFDPYLRFESRAEEEAYRRREAERQAYIASQQATNTPQGDLNAANTAIDLLNDARVHGADRSPAFDERLAALRRSRDRLRDSMAQSVSRESAPSEEQAHKSPEAPAQSANGDLDAAIAALREAGVKPASVSEETIADPRCAQPNSRIRAATSARV